ncbi:hypothetical protein ABW19_dt0203141 [Dactylella cylindrospora]|nr:hypothetical protein ABW19_dt0203141 [Dactylella cylindrospora]
MDGLGSPKAGPNDSELGSNIRTDRRRRNLRDTFKLRDDYDLSLFTPITDLFAKQTEQSVNSVDPEAGLDSRKQPKPGPIPIATGLPRAKLQPPSTERTSTTKPRPPPSRKATLDPKLRPPPSAGESSRPMPQPLPSVGEASATKPQPPLSVEEILGSKPQPPPIRDTLKPKPQRQSSFGLSSIIEAIKPKSQSSTTRKNSKEKSQPPLPTNELPELKPQQPSIEESAKVGPQISTSAVEPQTEAASPIPPLSASKILEEQPTSDSEPLGTKTPQPSDYPETITQLAAPDPMRQRGRQPESQPSTGSSINSISPQRRPKVLMVPQEGGNLTGTRGGRGYTVVNVLILTFESHDLEYLDAETSKVGSTFEQLGYRVETYAIPMADSSRQLMKKLGSFLMTVKPDELSIIYYHGRGATKYNDDETCLLFVSHKVPDEEGDPTPENSDIRRLSTGARGPSETIAEEIQWKDIRSEIMEAKHDTLIILDCSYAQLAATPDDSEVKPSNFRKVLIYSTHNLGTSTEDTMSKALCDSLRDAFGRGASLSTPDLVRGMIKISSKRRQLPPAAHWFLQINDRGSISLPISNK